MYNRYSSLVLRWLKVPREPLPPFGDPASLRVFRAGKNYFNLRLFGWAIGQAFVLAGIIFWAVFFIQVEEGVRTERARRAAAPAAAAAPPAETVSQRIKATAESAAQSVVEASQPAGAPGSAQPGAKPAKKRVRVGADWQSFKFQFIQLALTLPPWAFPLIWVLKITGLLGYLLQLPLTYAVMRLDFEMRWYVVTDRSLRIRTGVWSVQEITMSFANLQQVEVSQGPLQRLLGLADVKVHSAGGSDGEAEQLGHGDSLHTGHFHGVENAHEIRDLIQARLRHFRESGLGDPEETRHAVVPQASAKPAVTESVDTDVLAAARELAAEAKTLRVALG